MRPPVIVAARSNGRIAPSRVTPLWLLWLLHCSGTGCTSVARVWRLDTPGLRLWLLLMRRWRRWRLVVSTNRVLRGPWCIPPSTQRVVMLVVRMRRHTTRRTV